MMFVSVNREYKYRTIIEGTEFLPKCISQCSCNFLKSCEEIKLISIKCTAFISPTPLVNQLI